MKKIYYLILGALLMTAGTAFAVQISVPSAPGLGFFLVSTSTGNYQATTTDPLHAGSFFGTSTTATSSLAGNLVVNKNASTTNLWISSAGGTAGCATFGSDGKLTNTNVACGVGTFPFTPFANYNSTSTIVNFSVGFMANAASSTITGGLTTTNSTSTNATTTTFAITGAAANCNGTSALTTNVAGAVTCTAQPQGTVTAVSVVTANGFAGSSGGGATPALTLTTTITGLLKGNGTAISAATAGTDYDVFAWPFTPINGTSAATTSGIVISASSTIGNGTQQGGLTISGGATTTGIVLIANSGTVTAPSLVVGATGNAGLYLPSASTLGLTNGTNGLSWNGTAFTPNTNNVRDLGIVGTNQWQNLFVGAASTTSLTISSIQGCSGSSALTTSATGVVACSSISGGSGVFPFTPSTLGNSTSTLLIDTIGIISAGSSTIGGGAQNTGLTISGGATTTGNLTVIGAGTPQLAIGTSSAFSQIALHANASNSTFFTTLFAIGSSTQSSTSTLFSVSNTGSTTLFQTPSSLLKTDSNGTIIAAKAGIDYVLGSSFFSYLFPINGYGTSTGLGIFGSSTIGNGAQNGGLTVSGGATTTGNAAILSSLVIGTSTGVLGNVNANNGNLFLFNTNTAGASPALVMGGNSAGDTDFWFGRTNNNDTTNNDSLQIGAGLVPGTAPVMTWTYQGNEGIGSTSPFATLSIHANPTDLAIKTNLFMVGSSTQSATSTLFSINNRGQVVVTTNASTTLALTGVVSPGIEISFQYSTSTAFTGTTTLSLESTILPKTYQGISCFTDIGTLTVNLYSTSTASGVGAVQSLIASTTNNYNAISQNNAFGFGAKTKLDIGSPASSPTKITCTLLKVLTPQ